MNEKNETTKKRYKGSKGRIAGRIIAALMVIFMLVGSCYTGLYFIFNR